MNKDISIGDILQENFIRSSTDYISSIQKLPESSSIDEQTFYRNKITTDLLHSVFMANEPESFYQESSVYHFSHFDQDIPTVKPLLYFLEKINSMRITQESVSSIREAVEDLKSHILESIMGGSEVSISGDEYVDRLYRYFREDDESVNQESVAENTNSVLDSMKKYVSEYNSCVNTFRSFSNKMKDESMKSLVESVESLTNRYLKYANIAYAVKADSVRQYVLDTYNAHTESSKELYMPVKESVFDNFDIVGDDIIEENRIEYNTAYQSIAESQMINALLEDLSEEFNAFVEAVTANVGADGKDDVKPATNNATNNANADGEGITDKIVNFFKKIWNWIKSLFTTVSEEFQKNLDQIINEARPWLTKEQKQIEANAAKSTQQVSLPNFNEGIKRLNNALLQPLKTKRDDAINEYIQNNGFPKDGENSLLERLRREKVPEYGTKNPDKKDYMAFLGDYFTGADDVADKNISTLPIKDIIDTILNANNVTSIINDFKKSIQPLERDVAKATQDAEKMAKEHAEAIRREYNTSNTANKKAETGTKENNPNKNIKTPSVNDANTGTGGTATASTTTPTEKKEEFDIFNILSKYDSVRTITEADQPAQQQAQQPAAAEKKATTVNNGAQKGANKQVDFLRGIVEFNKTAANVIGNTCAAAMNAYRKMVVTYLNILNGLRNNPNNQEQNNANNGNNNAPEAQNASADIPYDSDSEPVQELFGLFEKKPIMSEQEANKLFMKATSAIKTAASSFKPSYWDLPLPFKFLIQYCTSPSDKQETINDILVGKGATICVIFTNANSYGFTVPDAVHEFVQQKLNKKAIIKGYHFKSYGGTSPYNIIELVKD